MLEEVDFCLDLMEQHILNYDAHVLPKSFHIYLTPALKYCQYYMIDSHPDHQCIFWLDKITIDLDADFDKETFLNSSHLRKYSVTTSLYPYCSMLETFMDWQYWLHCGAFSHDIKIYEDNLKELIATLRHLIMGIVFVIHHLCESVSLIR